MNNPISTRPSSGTFSVTFRRNDNPPQDHTAVQLSKFGHFRKKSECAKSIAEKILLKQKS